MPESKGLTLFSSIKDIDTSNVGVLDGWKDLVDFLFSMSIVPRTGKTDAPLFSPSVYREGSSRSNSNVTGWAGWAAFDVDDVDYEASALRKAMNDRFHDIDYVCYSTASSRAHQPKFRIVVNLTDWIRSEDLVNFWYAFREEFGALADEQTKDASRLFYVPGDYADAFNFIWANDGRAVDPSELISKHRIALEAAPGSLRSKLSPEMARKVVVNRLGSKTYTWTGYRDCPFVNRKLVREYLMIERTGWYAALYRIMVSIASKAIRSGYPIQPSEIELLIKELDRDTGSWYKDRPILTEAARAIEFAYSNA